MRQDKMRCIDLDLSLFYYVQSWSFARLARYLGLSIFLMAARFPLQQTDIEYCIDDTCRNLAPCQIVALYFIITS